MRITTRPWTRFAVAEIGVVVEDQAALTGVVVRVQVVFTGGDVAKASRALVAVTMVMRHPDQTGVAMPTGTVATDRTGERDVRKGMTPTYSANLNSDLEETGRV